MAIHIALVGNPNSGKTTLFNALTGSNQFVGNWPGVTVEKKEGKLKQHKDVVVVDLPGIYSLSPYTLEEVISRDYLMEQRPDVILNVVDGTNLERNLYLTTQLLELGIPLVIGVNMIDAVEKKGDQINVHKLAQGLGCPVVEISALKGIGIAQATQSAIDATKKTIREMKHTFSGDVEHTIAHIEEAGLHHLEEHKQRFYAIKLFERDEKIIQKLNLSTEQLTHIEKDIIRCETQLDDESESIITGQRYTYVNELLKGCFVEKSKGKRSTSDKIDGVLTQRVAAFPIFALVMFLVYFISVSTIGSLATEWANEGVFGEGWHFLGVGSGEYGEAIEHYEREMIGLENDSEQKPDPSSYGIWIPGVPIVVEKLLQSVDCADWLQELILDGIVTGVGAVLGFVPQLLILFFMLSFLEACGYMARVAFIMDRLFRRFGLSGKSFIPMLIGTGCSVPGIMASRTIENHADRKITIITTSFMPCSAKLPVIALISAALFGGSWWVAPSAYFLGIAAIICSGLILKKTRPFVGEVAPFVMELPPYYLPTLKNTLRTAWERGWSFVKKAGTVILLSSVFIWFVSRFGWVNGGFQMLPIHEMKGSLLAKIGDGIAFIFEPLGFGTWQFAVATLTGLVAKESVVSTLGVLFGSGELDENKIELWKLLTSELTALSAYSFLVFNLLCAPCFAALSAIRREMNNAKWFWFAVGYQTGFAYVSALWIYQLGLFFNQGSFSIQTGIAMVLFALFLFLLFFTPPRGMEKTTQ